MMLTAATDTQAAKPVQGKTAPGPVAEDRALESPLHVGGNDLSNPRSATSGAANARTRYAAQPHPRLGNQALLRGLRLQRAARPYVARQAAAPKANSTPSSFQTEVEKELDTAAGAGATAPKRSALKPSDQAYLQRQIVSGEVYSQANTGMVSATGEKQHDATLIAEHFLCTWNNRRVAEGQPRVHPHPLFCTDATVTAQIMKSDDVRVNFTEKYIYPGYDAAVAELQKQGAITQNQGKVSTVRPDTTKSDDPAQQSDLVLFAENLHAEAGLEVASVGTKALEAVAQVVHNRVVCTQKDARSNILKTNQFSWTRTDSPVHDQRFPKDASVWNQCIEVALRAINGSVDGGVGEATHYFSTAIAPPSWANDDCFVAQVGKHKFYKLNCLATDCAAPNP